MTGVQTCGSSDLWTKSLPPGELATESASGVTVHRLGLFGGLDFSLQHSLNVLEWLHQQRSFHGVWGHYVFPAGFMATLFAEMTGLPSTVSLRGNDIDRLMFPPGDSRGCSGRCNEPRCSRRCRRISRRRWMCCWDVRRGRR